MTGRPGTITPGILSIKTMRSVSFIVLFAALAIASASWADDERKAGGGSGRVTIGKLTVLGSMPRELIRRALFTRSSELDKCDARARKRKPHLSGTVKVKFVINSIGIVANATIAESTVRDPRLERCVARQIRKLKFPSTCGGIVIVTVPILFSSR